MKRKSIKISRLVSMFVGRRKHTNQIVNIETQHISSRIMINLVVYQIVDHITYTHQPKNTIHFSSSIWCMLFIDLSENMKIQQQTVRMLFPSSKSALPRCITSNQHLSRQRHRISHRMDFRVCSTYYVQHTIVMLFANDFMMTRRNTF